MPTHHRWIGRALALFASGALLQAHGSQGPERRLGRFLQQIELPGTPVAAIFHPEGGGFAVRGSRKDQYWFFEKGEAGSFEAMPHPFWDEKQPGVDQCGAGRRPVSLTLYVPFWWPEDEEERESIEGGYEGLAISSAPYLAASNQNGERSAGAWFLSHGISVGNLRYETEFKIEAYGFGPGEFRFPVDVALHDSGDLYVADQLNSRIQVFDTEGGFLRTFGDWGSFPGLFSFPSALEVPGDRVYVCDRGNHRIQVFDLQGEFLYQWGIHALRPREGRGRLHYPSSLAVSPDERFAVVVEPMDDRLQIFGLQPEEGADEATLTSPDPGQVSAHFGRLVHGSGDLLAISAPDAQQVLIYDASTSDPVLITRVAEPGDGYGQLRTIDGLWLDESSGSLFVSDAGNARVSQFELGPRNLGRGFDPLLARFVRCFDVRVQEKLDRRAEALAARNGGAVTIRLPPPTKFWPRPGTVVAIPSDSLLTILDEANLRFVHLDSTFTARKRELSIPDDEWGGLRVNESGFLSQGRAAGDGEQLESLVHFLCEASSDGIVRVLRSSGVLVDTVPLDPAPLCPGGMHVNARGEIFVTDVLAHCVRKYDLEGKLIKQWGSKGLGKDNLYKPRGITELGDGRLVVSDHGNHRAMIYDQEGNTLGVFGSRLYTLPARRELREAAEGEGE